MSLPRPDLDGQAYRVRLLAIFHDLGFLINKSLDWMDPMQQGLQLHRWYCEEGGVR